MERINVGMLVDIRRSDGRVHSATICEVREGTQSVTVEWFENGETKGKEIDLKALLAINPTLTTTQLSSMNFVSLASEEENTCEFVRASELQLRTQNNTEGMPFSRTSDIGTFYTTAARNGGGFRTNLSGYKRVSSLQTPNKPSKQNTHRFPLDQSCLEFDFLTGSSTSGAVQNMAKFGLSQNIHKPSVVREIGRLQRNREERIAQLVEAKKHKEQLGNIDPGNPNWQFLTMIRDYQSQIDFRPLKISDQVTDHQICVCVRKRPLNRKEIMKKEIEVITIPNKDHLIVHQPQVKVDLTKYLDNQKFRFDYTFDENTSNEMVYRFTAQPLVKTIFEQGFATCFAYGQTGSGKTHTMGGDFNGKTQDCSKGIYSLAAGDVFKLLHKNYKMYKLEVSCSFFEIYGGKLFDLIGKRSLLRVFEDGKKEVQVVGLQEIVVNDESDVLDLIRKGSALRTAGTTSANPNSSRSHAVFQIILRRKTERTEKGLGRIWGKFSLIDLAGNERGVDTVNTDRQTRMESAEINKSLLALKECIRAMGRNSAHIPFRASKLTLVLRDSFIGSKAKTCMIAMISPGMSCCEHTLNTLRYADRVKELGADESSNAPLEDEHLMLKNIGENYNLLKSKNELNDKNQCRVDETLQNICAVEELLYNELTALYEDSDKVKESIVSLLERSSKLDYDIDSFANGLVNFAREQRDRYSRLCENAEHLVTELNRETEIIKKSSNHNKKHEI